MGIPNNNQVKAKVMIESDQKIKGQLSKIKKQELPTYLALIIALSYNVHRGDVRQFDLKAGYWSTDVPTLAVTGSCRGEGARSLRRTIPFEDLEGQKVDVAKLRNWQHSGRMSTAKTHN